MYLKHRPHKNYTWRKCSRVLTNCLVVTKMSKWNLYVSCASKGLIFWGKLAVIPKLLHYRWVMVPEGWKTSMSQKSTHSKESNTSKDNDRAISFDPCQKLRSQWTTVYRCICVLGTKYPAVYVLNYFCTWILYQ